MTRKIYILLDVTWGFMNMLPDEGYFLNVTALKTTQQPTNDRCIIDCVHVTNCFSINVIQQQGNGTVQCQLLSGNKHQNSTVYVSHNGSTHFYIPVSTLLYNEFKVSKFIHYGGEKLFYKKNFCFLWYFLQAFKVVRFAVLFR